MKRHRVKMACAVMGGVLSVSLAAGSLAQNSKPQPVAMPLEQARQTVEMLNDVYVTSVVLTHGTYVKDRGTVAAATVARQVFEAVDKKGWPATRWLSTGQPFNPDHKPKDSFERDAAAAFKKGETRLERVENGKLRVAYLVPVVDKSCLTCHTKDKVGDPIGGLVYTVPLKR